MQEKEMTQRRTDTETLSQWAEYLSGYFLEDSSVKKQLIEIADRLEEQQATIKALRSELVELTAKAMSQEDTIRHLRIELCNASAVAMEHVEAIKALGGQVA